MNHRPSNPQSNLLAVMNSVQLINDPAQLVGKRITKVQISTCEEMFVAFTDGSLAVMPDPEFENDEGERFTGLALSDIDTLVDVGILGPMAVAQARKKDDALFKVRVDAYNAKTDDDNLASIDITTSQISKVLNATESNVDIQIAALKRLLHARESEIR